VGVDSLSSNTSGTNNVAVGLGALKNHPNGFGNIAIGNSALSSMTFGGGNVQVGVSSASFVNDPVYAFTTESNRIAIGSNSVTNAYVRVAWTVVSDARDKTNVTALPVGLDFVNALNPVSFQYKENRENDVAVGPVHYGFLAQEVLAAEGDNPVIVDTEKPESLKMINDHLNAVFVKAIQELSAKNDALEARIAQLENS
jgi:hypothetical protein